MQQTYNICIYYYWSLLRICITLLYNTLRHNVYTLAILASGGKSLTHTLASQPKLSDERWLLKKGEPEKHKATSPIRDAERNAHTYEQTSQVQERMLRGGVIFHLG